MTHYLVVNGLITTLSFQVSVYLKLLAQFQELGFASHQIKSALVTTQLDEEKTLDILTCSW